MYNAPSSDELKTLAMIMASSLERAGDQGPSPVPELTEQSQAQACRQAKLVERLLELEATAAERAATLAADEAAAAQAAAEKRVVDERQAAERYAAEKASRVKAYRSWQPVPGEFDNCPQVPQAGQVMKYFATENGIKGAREDPRLDGSEAPLSRSTLPPRPAEVPATTAFSTPGVYAARSAAEPADVPDDMASTTAATASARETAPVTHAGEPSPSFESTMTFEAAGAQLQGSQQMDKSSAATCKLPSIYRVPRAATELNEDLLRREYETMRLANTASAALVRARGRDACEFVLGCAAIDFGVVPRGGAASQQLPLHNVSLAPARFSVDQVSPPLHLSYPRGAVPVGLKASIRAEFRPREDEPLGLWSSSVVVRSPFNVLRCPACAQVVEAPVAEETAVTEPARENSRGSATAESG